MTLKEALKQGNNASKMSCHCTSCDLRARQKHVRPSQRAVSDEDSGQEDQEPSDETVVVRQGHCPLGWLADTMLDIVHII